VNTKRYHIIKRLCPFTFRKYHHGDMTCWLFWSWRPLTEEDKEES